MSYGLGRIASVDPADGGFLMRALVGATPSTIRLRYWHDSKWFGDQGSTSQCVEYAWHHWVDCGPVRPMGKAPFWNPLGTVYNKAQLLDEWPGEAYDGTSVRAGAKALQELGFIESYAWAWDLQTVVDAVLEKGPVVMGTNWYDSMFNTDANGYLKITGNVAGGHAWCITGVNRIKGVARGKNSWSRQWGRGGRFLISFEDLERLILEDGEACLAVEKSGL